MLATPSSTPQAALAWDCGVFKMKFRIMKAKLSFLHYLLVQKEGSLARQVLQQQIQHNFPGLVKECKEFIQKWSILDPFEHWLSPKEWKKMVNEAIRETNGNELNKDIIEKIKKLKTSELAKEEFCRKDYLKDMKKTSSVKQS